MMKLFSGNKTKITAKVVFRAEAAAIGEHGSIYADSKKYNVENDPVAFAFVGVTEIPALDVAVLKHIEDQAAAAGFVMRSLRSYATVMTVQPRPRLNMTNIRNSASVHSIPQRPASNNSKAYGGATPPGPRNPHAPVPNPNANMNSAGTHYTNPTVVPRA